MKFNNYPELINHHKEHVKIDWAIEEKTGIPKRSSDKNILLAYTDDAEDNLEHIVKTNLTNLIHPIIANLIYPRGSVIMTTDPDFDPATQFGGTWTKWTDGYLKVDGGTPSTGKNDVKGATDYKITTSMMPKHTHSFEHTHEYTPTGSVSGGDHRHEVMLDTGGNLQYAKTIYNWSNNEKDGKYITGAGSDDNWIIKSSGNLSLSFEGDKKSTTSQSVSRTELVGGDSAYQPKYYAVIAWQRIA